MHNTETNTCRSREERISDSDLEIIEIRSPEHQTDHAEYLDGEDSPRSKNTVHLWEYLLELLADESCRSIITWSRKLHGEFKIKSPQEIASRWGRLKHRPGMTYEKLSRALRHYYSKGIIKKVKGQRLVYRFDKLPYEYTTGRECLPSNDSASTPKTTIRQDEYKYNGPSPCSKTNVDGSNQALLDRDKMRRFFEERLFHNMKNKTCNPPETQSPVKLPEQGYTDESDKGKLAYNTQQEVEIISTMESPEHSHREWNNKSPASSQEEQETRSFMDSPERSTDFSTSGFRPVVPIPVLPSICPECVTDRLMSTPVIRSSLTVLPISTNGRTGFVPHLRHAATSIPVSVIRTIRG